MEVTSTTLHAQCGAITSIPDRAAVVGKGFYLCTVRENSSTDKTMRLIWFSNTKTSK